MQYRIKKVRVGRYVAHDSKPRRVFGLADHIVMRAAGTTIPRTFTRWAECIHVMQLLSTNEF